ncbi:MAG: MFS transporter, partial [Candidatus Thorarchaeota archaeon]
GESSIIKDDIKSSLNNGEKSTTILDEMSKDPIQSNEKTNGKGIFWSVSIFSSTNQNFFTQFFAAFARIVGVSASILGFLTSIVNLLTGLFQGTIGRLSDKLGRKYILITGFILSFLVTIPLIFFENTILLIFVAILQAFSVSIAIPTWNAVLGDVTEPRNRAAFIGKISSIGRIISVTITLLVAGFFFLTTEVYEGITIGGWTYIIPWRVQYSVAFGFSSFNALLCAINLLFFKETRKMTNNSRLVPKMRIAFQDKKFVKFLVVNSIFGITMSLIWPLNPIILIDTFELTFAQVAIMTSSFTIFTGLAQIFGGKLSDKLGRKPLIILSIFILVLFPVSIVPALVTGNWTILLLSRFVGGLGTGINLVAISSYTLDMAPQELMGGYSGIRETFYGIATFIGSFSAGFIIDALLKVYDIYITSMAMSIGVTVIRIIAAIGYFFIAETLPREKERSKMKFFQH